MKIRPDIMAKEMDARHGAKKARDVVGPYLAEFFKDKKGVPCQRNIHAGYFRSVNSYLKKIKGEANGRTSHTQKSS